MAVSLLALTKCQGPVTTGQEVPKPIVSMVVNGLTVGTLYMIPGNVPLVKEPQVAMKIR